MESYEKFSKKFLQNFIHEFYGMKDAHNMHLRRLKREITIYSVFLLFSFLFFYAYSYSVGKRQQLFYTIYFPKIHLFRDTYLYRKFLNEHRVYKHAHTNTCTISAYVYYVYYRSVRQSASCPLVREKIKRKEKKNIERRYTKKGRKQPIVKETQKQLGKYIARSKAIDLSNYLLFCYFSFLCLEWTTNNRYTNT